MNEIYLKKGSGSKRKKNTKQTKTKENKIKQNETKNKRKTQRFIE